ncbi:MAG: hypothetical protein ACI9CF_000911 [Candidatus Omnitrophota bacterium]|jgi:hypothetical protein
MGNEHEKRKYTRLIARHVLQCQKYSFKDLNQAKRMTSVVKNISAGGALFESKEKYQIGDILKLEIDIKGWQKFDSGFYKSDLISGSKPIVALGSVVRMELVNPDQLYDVGVCFVGIDDGHQWTLIKYINNKIAHSRDI